MHPRWKPSQWNKIAIGGTLQQSPQPCAVTSMDLAFRHFWLQKRARFLDLLYPPEFQTSDDFDCLQPILTLSMFPEKLDLDQNGFWSQALRLWKRGVVWSCVSGPAGNSILLLVTVLVKPVVLVFLGFPGSPVLPPRFLVVLTPHFDVLLVDVIHLHSFITISCFWGVLVS